MKNFKFLMLIPLCVFLISCFFIGQALINDGTPVYRDISLKGGLSAVLNVESSMSAYDFQNLLSEKFTENAFLVSELSEQGINKGFIVETDLDEEEFLEFAKSYFKLDFVSGENYTSNFISPSLSDSFFKQAMYVLLISFFLMSSVIFIYFRQLVPAGAVVLSALFDVVATIGILDMFGVELSIAGVGALLMLIGYSIDTDILLTNRLIKEKGKDYFEKLFGAFQTGALMLTTTLCAGVAALFLTNSDVIREIAIILVIGLIIDAISTWLSNAPILLWWLEKKGELEVKNN